MLRTSGSVILALLLGCGQNAPQPIPIQPAPGQPAAPVPGQPWAQPAPGFPVAPVAPVAPITPQQPIAIAPVTPQTTLVPGQVGGPTTALVPTNPVAVVPGQVQAGVPQIPPPPPGADARAAERMREYTVQMIATGYMPHGNPGADTLGPRQSDNFQITLSGGDCYTIAGFGGAGVRDLDAYLYSPSGRQLVRDFATDSRPIVRSCATETGQYRVRFHMYAGAGPYTYQVYRSAGAAVQAQGLAGIDPVVRRRMDLFTARRLAKGYRASPGISGSGTLTTRMSQNFTANFETGRCYTIAGFGGTGVSDLDIFLLAPAGNQVARDERTDAEPDVNHCPSFPGPYTIRVLMYSGNGAFAMQGYQTGM